MLKQRNGSVVCLNGKKKRSDLEVHSGDCALLQFSDLGVSCNGETGAKPIPNRFTCF